MDAVFGFSFEGEPRAPFDTVIKALKETKKPILSVDIPSAWNVERGDPEGKYFTPGESISDLYPVDYVSDACLRREQMFLSL
jgi:NAD(P)H-hydrate epimerase